MPGKWKSGGFHFVGRVIPCYNLTVRALAIGHFFVVTAFAGLAVGIAHGLQKRHRQAWLAAYTIFLASWGAVALLSVVQHMLAWEFLPHSVWNQVQVVLRPLFAVVYGSTFYFSSAFLAQATGGRLSRAFTVAYVSVWTVAGVGISVGSALAGESPPEAVAIAASVTTLLFKVGIMYGSFARALIAIRRIEDPLDRAGLQRFVLLQLAGLLAFELAVRDVAWLVGRTPNAVIALVQVGGSYPALLWLGTFLRRREVARPAEPQPAHLKLDLAALGLSARESDVIELLLLGLSHKEIAERLFIAPDTVKKHTYNAYRKLGVQNRVQLSYFVQNRVARRD